jgi:hypothetical protein
VFRERLNFSAGDTVPSNPASYYFKVHGRAAQRISELVPRPP